MKRSEEKAKCKMGYSLQSAVLKREIEAKLASRIPAALSPQALQVPRLMSSGVPEIDGLLGGGMPIGGVTEFTGLASSGRTSLAFSLLAGATTDSACAYIDVDDTLDPKCAAASGVNHKNLLWVRVANQSRARSAESAPASVPGITLAQTGKMVGGHCGSNHPQTEKKGIDAALGKMLTQNLRLGSKSWKVLLVIQIASSAWQQLQKSRWPTSTTTHVTRMSPTLSGGRIDVLQMTPVSALRLLFS